MRYLILTHYHAVRVLGASAFGVVSILFLGRALARSLPTREGGRVAVGAHFAAERRAEGEVRIEEVKELRLGERSHRRCELERLQSALQALAKEKYPLKRLSETPEHEAALFFKLEDFDARSLFAEMDEDASGYLDQEEVNIVMKMMGKKLKKKRSGCNIRKSKTTCEKTGCKWVSGKKGVRKGYCRKSKNSK